MPLIEKNKEEKICSLKFIHKLAEKLVWFFLHEIPPVKEQHLQANEERRKKIYYAFFLLRRILEINK